MSASRLIKGLLALFAGFLVLFFVTTMVSIFTELEDWACALIALPGAAFVTRQVWRSAVGSETGVRAGPGGSILAGALIVGGLGFAGGFLGPMILAPDANQGPMLGLFITGPLGAVLGMIAGFVYWKKQSARSIRS